jgi:hypothetical protein
MENLVVMLRLNVGQINRMLSLLGTHPFNTVSDLISEIKGQGDMQIAAAQAAAAAPPPVAPSEPDKPSPMPPLTDPPTKEVVRAN